MHYWCYCTFKQSVNYNIRTYMAVLFSEAIKSSRLSLHTPPTRFLFSLIWSLYVSDTRKVIGNVLPMYYDKFKTSES
jgi:hypothetical protein